MTGNDMSVLRAEYEAAVRALRTVVDTMRAEGHRSEVIARTVHARRRALTVSFKARTPEPAHSVILRSTVERYGDPLGPTIEKLRARKKSWDDIADSAARPGNPPQIDGSPS